METIEDKNLKNYIDSTFDFNELKKLGFFKKGTRRSDYNKIAERICTWFGFENIYEYEKYRECDNPACQNKFTMHFKKNCPHLIRTNADICRNTKGWEPLKLNIVEICTQDRYQN